MLAWAARLLHRPGDPAALGRRGERRAARMLRRLGYRVLGRNVRLKVGEADIVCIDPDGRTVVIVEVKTRLRGGGTSLLGETVAPEASIHAHKRRKLLAVSRALIRANGWTARPCRIDVVAVEWPASGATPTLRHHKGAVRP